MADFSLQVFDPVLIGGGVAALIFVGVLLFLTLGRWLGRQTTVRYGAASSVNIGSLESAVFALMGLLIAFTFSGALNRFDVRRAQVVQEANAIGTAWLRVDLLPAASQPLMRDNFRKYVDSRIETYRELNNLANARRDLAISQKLQGEIWALAVAATRAPDSQSARLLLLPALNEMFDITTVRVAASQMHPPLIIYAMLVGLALAAALLAGYQSALEKARDWVHQIGFATIVAFTVYVILDIEYPRLGFVRMDAIDTVLMNVRLGMN